MKISELITQLTDNLSDEQKAMDAQVLDSDGQMYTINTVLIAAVALNTQVAEGQPVLASFGEAETE